MPHMVRISLVTEALREDLETHRGLVARLSSSTMLQVALACSYRRDTMTMATAMIDDDDDDVQHKLGQRRLARLRKIVSQKTCVKIQTAAGLQL